MTHTVQRVVLLRALQLGDMLTAVPALRSLREGFPRAEITLIGLPWAEQFAQRFGHYIDRFVPLAHPESDSGAREQFLERQRAHRYDLAIDMQGDGSTGSDLIAGLGAWGSAGYYVGEPPEHLTVAALYPHDRHEIFRNLELVQLLGCPNIGPELEFPLFLEDRREAVSLLGRLPTDGPVIGLHPGSRSHARRWPPERFAALADHLSRRFRAVAVLLGDDTERETVRAVMEYMEMPAIDLAGRTSLGGLGAVIERLDLLIGNESGPAHLAYAMRTPSVTIVDRSLSSSVCGFERCPIHQTHTRHTLPDQVFPAAEHLLCDTRGADRALWHVPAAQIESVPAGWARF